MRTSWLYMKLRNRGTVKCVQAEVRVLLVGMMGKILAGDTRGVSAALLQSLQQTISQVGFLTCTCPVLGEEFFV